MDRDLQYDEFILISKALQNASLIGGEDERIISHLNEAFHTLQKGYSLVTPTNFIQSHE